MADVPHFDLPFRYVSSSPAVAEQDSLADIINCVQAVLLTVQGQRTEIPEFGVPEQVFAVQPLHLEEMLASVLEYEPRANIVFDQYPDRADALIAHIVATVTKREV